MSALDHELGVTSYFLSPLVNNKGLSTCTLALSMYSVTDNLPEKVVIRITDYQLTVVLSLAMSQYPGYG